MPVYRMAELNVEMNPRFPLLERRAAPYRVDGEPDFTLTPPPKPADEPMSDETFEYTFYEGMFYRKLLRYNGFLLHASALCRDGGAYLFSAPPGTGKSTHTAMWMNISGRKAAMINDDKPALRFINGVCHACGTPFSGNSPVNAPLCVPAKGICFLERGEENEIRRIAPGEAFPLFYEETVRFLTKADAATLLRLMTRTADAVPLYRMRCRPDRAAAELAIQTMTGGLP